MKPRTMDSLADCVGLTVTGVVPVPGEPSGLWSIEFNDGSGVVVRTPVLWRAARGAARVGSGQCFGRGDDQET